MGRNMLMRSIKSLIVTTGMAASMLIFAGTSSISAQETMMKQTANKVVSGTKKGYNRGRRVGHTVGNRTWNGSRWVASESWRGGKWVAVKTTNGTKWVYRKGRRGTKRVL
jgi:hypothetical protein